MPSQMIRIRTKGTTELERSRKRNLSERKAMRTDFFRTASKVVLPMLAATLLGSLFLAVSHREKDNGFAPKRQADKLVTTKSNTGSAFAR